MPGQYFLLYYEEHGKHENNEITKYLVSNTASIKLLIFPSNNIDTEIRWMENILEEMWS